ncbi:hypothetical protein [Streptosporangium sp. 'caverna']|uniref:hypothetical protein n=1 Tax=Streptosporangium sp. 'caverna' TaxID=2202249 RepID=UPI0019551091|nr:hypothetical protein [Streptosporangium sp. 'caverna']
MSTAPALDPARTVLLVTDYQPAILTLLPESDGEALLGRMEKAIADVRAAGGTVAYVRVADRCRSEAPAAVGVAPRPAGQDVLVRKSRKSTG